MLKVLYGLCLAISILDITLAMVRVNNFECKVNKSICHNSRCMMTRTRGQMAYISVGCNVTQVIPKPILRIRLLRKFGNRYDFYRISIDQDICDFANVNTKDFFMNRMLSLVSKYLINFQCPVASYVNIKKMPVMLYLAEAMFPEAEYRVQSLVFYKDIEILHINISYTVTKSLLM